MSSVEPLTYCDHKYITIFKRTLPEHLHFDTISIDKGQENISDALPQQNMKNRSPTFGITAQIASQLATLSKVVSKDLHARLLMQVFDLNRGAAIWNML